MMLYSRKENNMKIKNLDMKVLGNLDSWLTDIYEQPSQFSSPLYDDSTQSMYAEQMLEILDMVKEMYIRFRCPLEKECVYEKD